jgi:hypothetical protein
MGQFTTYLVFAIVWPLLFALVYWQLERLWPSVFAPKHKDV